MLDAVFALVAVLTLPNNSSTVYEVQGHYKTIQECNRDLVKVSQTKDRYRKNLLCLPIDKD